jgi:hypothetical protein
MMLSLLPRGIYLQAHKRWPDLTKEQFNAILVEFSQENSGKRLTVSQIHDGLLAKLEERYGEVAQ